MDWPYSLQTSRQHYMTSLNLESKGEQEKEDDLETLGAAIRKESEGIRLFLEESSNMSVWQPCTEEDCSRSLQ